MIIMSRGVIQVLCWTFHLRFHKSTETDIDNGIMSDIGYALARKRFDFSFRSCRTCQASLLGCPFPFFTVVFLLRKLGCRASIYWSMCGVSKNWKQTLKQHLHHSGTGLWRQIRAAETAVLTNLFLSLCWLEILDNAWITSSWNSRI